MNSLKQLNTRRELASLEKIELAIDEVCHDLKIEGTAAYFITLAISELASNMIRHGKHENQLQDDLVVEVFSSNESIKVVLKDHCRPLSNTVQRQLLERDGTVRQYDTSIQNIPESGWGLDLIHSAASSVSYCRAAERNVYELGFKIEANPAGNDDVHDLYNSFMNDFPEQKSP